jgi:hypothetical protein
VRLDIECFLFLDVYYEKGDGLVPLFPITFMKTLSVTLSCLRRIGHVFVSQIAYGTRG